MTRFCPHYPPPAARRPSLWTMFFSKRRSWLDSLYARSYTMKMGEVHLPGIDLYMVNEPALVRRVLVDEAAAFPKHAMLGDALRPLLGDSIFTTNGAVWQRQRSLMNPSFEAARVRHVYGRMREAAEAMLARLRGVPEGAEHDLETEMTHVAADIILRTILSQPLDGGDARRIFEAFERYQALAPRLMMPAFFGLRWLRPWWQVRRSRQAAEAIRSLLSALIQPRHAAFHAARAAGEAGADGDDILATLLRVRDPASGEGFRFEELVDQVAMLFLAGHETSASALSWALHLLAHAPEVQQRLHEEALRQLGPGPLPAEAGAVKGLVLARNVFRETLRLFPPVGFLAREAAQACPMRDKQLPAGASVLVSPWLIHRHRGLWADPDAFDPDRYGAEDETVPEAAEAAAAAEAEGPALPGARESLRRAYLPFGLGPRVCIGAAFAWQEGALVLAALAREFVFEPVEGHVPEPVGRLTIRSDNGIRLRIRRRPPLAAPQEAA